MAVGAAVVVEGGKGSGEHGRSRGGGVGGEGGCDGGGQVSHEGGSSGVLIFE